MRGQKGSALLMVTVVGVVISTAFTLFMNSTVMTEQREVERELAKARVYWAEMGDFNYAFSRISFSSFCGGVGCGGNNKDTDLATALQAYFNELSNNKTWTYVDESSNYSFTTTITAAADNNPLRQNYSGWLMATSSYTPSSLLASSAVRLPLMELRFCAGMADASKKCGNIANNNGGNDTAYFSINRLTNLPSP